MKYKIDFYFSVMWQNEYLKLSVYTILIATFGNAIWEFILTPSASVSTLMLIAFP